MNKLLILGGGTAGTIMANKMRKRLPPDKWSITVIDKEREHFYQPGFLFLPFGYYKRSNIVKPGHKFFPKGVKVIYNEIDRIDAGGKCLYATAPLHHSYHQYLKSQQINQLLPWTKYFIRERPHL